MGPKKKQNKPACNAFFFYMQEVQREKSTGGRRISMEEASKIAGERWKLFTSQQKAPFEKRAAEEKARYRNCTERFTSQGISYSEIDREQRAAREKDEKMKNKIFTTVHDSFKTGNFIGQEYYFIDINIFCETNQNYFVPAELAVTKFSLGNGVDKFYHTLIDPKEIPTGYQYEASSYSNEYHQLPLPPDALGESDILKILTQLIDFVLGVELVKPPLYTLPKNMHKIEAILKQFGMTADIDCEFEVFSISELYLQMRKFANPGELETLSLVEIDLEKDVYDYFKGLACEYHETTDAIPQCSLSRAKRWGYIICDYLGAFLHINLIPGFHLPPHASVKRNQRSLTVPFEEASTAKPYGASTYPVISTSGCALTSTGTITTASDYDRLVKGKIVQGSSSVGPGRSLRTTSVVVPPIPNISPRQPNQSVDSLRSMATIKQALPQPSSRNVNRTEPTTSSSIRFGFAEHTPLSATAQEFRPCSTASRPPSVLENIREPKLSYGQAARYLSEDSAGPAANNGLGSGDGWTLVPSRVGLGRGRLPNKKKP